MSKINYLLIKGERSQTTISDVEKNFRKYVFSQEEILKMLDSSANPTDKIRAYYHLSIAAGSDYNDEFFSKLKCIFSEPDPDVQTEAMYALSYVDWPEVQELVAKLSLTTYSDAVRQAAKLLLDAYKKVKEDGTWE